MDPTGFVKQIGYVVLGAAVLGAYPLYAYASAPMVLGVALGCAICTVNVLVGGLLAVRAFEKPQPAFLRIFFGGMAARMAGIGLVFFLLVKYSDVHVLGLTVSMFLFYVVFQILEIRFLAGNLSGRRTPTEET